MVARTRCRKVTCGQGSRWGEAVLHGLARNPRFIALHAGYMKGGMRLREMLPKAIAGHC